MQNLVDPSFFATSTMGEAHGLLEGEIIPFSASHPVTYKLFPVGVGVSSLVVDVSGGHYLCQYGVALLLYGLNPLKCLKLFLNTERAGPETVSSASLKCPQVEKVLIP